MVLRELAIPPYWYLGYPLFHASLFEADASLPTKHNSPIVYIFLTEWKTKENRGIWATY